MQKENAPPQGELLEQTISELIPLYTDRPDDSPENVLCSYPDAARTVEALGLLIDLLLPGRTSPGTLRLEEIGLFLNRRLRHVRGLLVTEIERAVPFRWHGQAARTEGPPAAVNPRQEAECIMDSFVRSLPEVRRYVIEDIRAAYEGDPAALTYAEVQLSYPGLLAVVCHRLAHVLYLKDVPIVPRVMSEWTHSRTGVDIHPGARIGHGLFIDHATGVVIGETCRIGNRVKIYQGVTLGAKSFPLDDQGRPIKHIQRHPTVEDDVVIYSNASILGGDTVIGKGSTIGGNVFLDESVPPNSMVANKHPELKIKAQS